MCAKKKAGRTGLRYRHALDEALCYGWIDGISNRIDAERYAQRFTPRQERSRWSSSNVARYGQLLKQGRVTEAGRKAFAARLQAFTPHMTASARAWHLKHPMPKPATLEQRIAWHRAHQKHCACRPIPERLRPYFAEGKTRA